MFNEFFDNKDEVLPDVDEYGGDKEKFLEDLQNMFRNARNGRKHYVILLTEGLCSQSLDIYVKTINR
jgi:hypothetical protein